MVNPEMEAFLQEYTWHHQYMIWKAMGIEEGTLASGHVTMSNTWTVCSGNILEWWNSLWEGEEQGCLE